MTLELTNIFGGAMGQRIGWALVHFLWQGAVVAAVLGVVLQLMHRWSAQSRYVVSCCALALMLVLPVATGAMITPKVDIARPELTMSMTQMIPIATGESPNRDPIETNETSGTTSSVAPAVVRNWVQTHVTRYLPWMVAAWVIGMVGMSLWQLSGWLLLQRIRRMGIPLSNAEVTNAFDRLRDQMAVRLPVKLLDSGLVRAPLVIGWLKPAILLPASVLSGLNQGQIEAILAHELAHIRRWDCLVRMVQAATETILFFHPAVWWVSARVIQESENCCDEIAVEICGDRQTYARALAMVAGVGGGRTGLAPAASGGQLLPRLRRILGVGDERRMGRTLMGAIVAVVIVISAVAGGALSAKEASVVTADGVETRRPNGEKGAGEQAKRRVTGLVLDVAGKPLVGADVAAVSYSATRDAVLGRTTSRADGKFLMDVQGDETAEVFAYV